MRAAFVTADVLAAEPERAVTLRRLHDAGLQPVVVVARPLPEGEKVESAGFPVVTCRPDRSDCDETATILIDAAAQAALVTHEVTAVSEAFLVCRELADVALATAAGCRPVMVLDGRSLDEVMGLEEPAVKDMASAPDLAAAMDYVLDEVAQDTALGPFPFATPHLVDERSQPLLPTRGDLWRLYVVVIAAGLAAALGIAYLLREVYTFYRFPFIAYYLTLQFIPQTWRGVLFLLIAFLIGLMAPRLLTGLQRRRYS